MQEFAENGKIKLYRGVKYDYKNAGALESWTDDYNTALGFAKGKPENVRISEIDTDKVFAFFGSEGSEALAGQREFIVAIWRHENDKT